MTRILRFGSKPTVYLSLILLSTSLVSCTKSESKTDSGDAKRYPFKGTVVSVDKAAKKAKIDHEAIPGYMEAMTMDFPIKEDWVWDALTPGSEVRADLVIAKDGYWLEKIGIVAAADPNKPAPPINENFAQVGKEIPDFKLTNQDGKRISLKDFHGKALAITFIYRECPLPDYCIRMSQNFSDLANRFMNDPEAKDAIRLLSISFDPDRDTPEKLKQYGIGYMGNPSNANFSIWQLAVGPDAEVRKMADFFGLRYEVDPNNKAQIIHSLRTIVVSPSGKVVKIFPGNEWTPDELARELKAASSSAA
jgi:protein SCO1/2